MTLTFKPKSAHTCMPSPAAAPPREAPGVHPCRLSVASARGPRDTQAMKEATWKALEEQFSRFPVMRGIGGTADAVRAAQDALGSQFHPDYRDFLYRYGSAMVGAHAVYGVEQVTTLGSDWSVVALSQRFRKDGWPGVANWYVISSSGDGSPIGIANDGSVWISDHLTGVVRQLAPSFEDFLASCIE